MRGEPVGQPDRDPVGEREDGVRAECARALVRRIDYAPSSVAFDAAFAK
jgi:hypothetical protein